MAKRITVDQLAAMVSNGFQTLQDEMQGGLRTLRDEMHGGFQTLRDEMRGRFAVVEDELKDLRTDVGRIERKLNSAIDQLDDHSVRLRRLEDPAQG